MSSTTSRGLIQPTVGGDTAAWGGYLNNNFGYINQMFGTILEISVTSGATLTTTQTQNGVIRFTGTLTSNVDVNFPNVSGVWWIDNRTTGNYYVRVKMTTGANATIGLPQGVITPVRIESGTDGGTTTFPGASFLNTPLPGTFWDYSSGTTPVWFGGCTSDGTTAQLPWLVCDGSTYSISAYPYLGNILGSTWGGNGATTFGVPDLRNRVRVPVMPSTPRISLTNAGIDGSTVGQAGGSDGSAISIAQMPTHNHVLNESPHYHYTFNTDNSTASGVPVTGTTYSQYQGGGSGNFTAYTIFGNSVIPTLGQTSAVTTGITMNTTGGSQIRSNTQPTAITGLTFIKT